MWVCVGTVACISFHSFKLSADADDADDADADDADDADADDADAGAAAPPAALAVLSNAAASWRRLSKGCTSALSLANNDLDTLCFSQYASNSCCQRSTS